jgi:hypothetical protein
MPDPETLQLTESEQANFETLQRAIASGDAALLATRRKDNGEPAALVCAMNVTPTAIEAVPLAILSPDGESIYDTYEDPTK